ncbi:MAG: ATP-binding protein [Atopobiaceae bacterium]|jgi:hypothetical protein
MAESDDDLTRFVESMTGDGALRVEEELGDGFVKLRIGEAERRQAKHDIRCVEDAVVEMLRNARDAGARRIFVATGREGDLRTLVVLDDGEGIPEPLHAKVFEARVTSKLESVHMDRWGVHGRGMALYSISQNAVEARVVASAPGKGSVLKVVTDATQLAEKADQSTWPTVGSDEEGRTDVVRGPHNIVRAVCEFALESRGACEVYLGSAAEVVATAYRRVRPHISEADVLFLDDLSSLPVVERLAVSGDASELAANACALGLEISGRTAHRIVSGQVKPLRSVAGRLLGTRSHGDAAHAPSEVDLGKDRRGLKMSREDVDAFARMLERDFSFVSERYYLQLKGIPRVRVSAGRLVVTFDVTNEE